MIAVSMIGGLALMFRILEEMMGRETFREFRHGLTEERRIWGPPLRQSAGGRTTQPPGPDGPADGPVGNGDETSRSR
jgi:hypothetical protein